MTDSGNGHSHFWWQKFFFYNICLCRFKFCARNILWKVPNITIALLFLYYIVIPWASHLSYPVQDIEMSTRSCSRVRFSFIPPMGIRSLSITGGHWNVHPQLHRDTYIHPMGLNHCRILRLPLSAALEHLNSSNQHPFALAQCRSLILKMTKNE